MHDDLGVCLVLQAEHGHSAERDGQPLPGDLVAEECRLLTHERQRPFQFLTPSSTTVVAHAPGCRPGSRSDRREVPQLRRIGGRIGALGTVLRAWLRNWMRTVMVTPLSPWRVIS